MGRDSTTPEDNSQCLTDAPANAHPDVAGTGPSNPVTEMAAHLRTLLNNTHDLIILATETGTPIYANPAWQRRFGNPMAVTDPFTRVHPDDTERVDRAWQDMLDGHQDITDLQYRIITPDGDELVFESTVREIHDGGERFFYVITHEATPRIQAESALRESESKFRNFFDRNPTWMTVSRLSDGLYLEVNEAFCKTTGYTREEVIGRTSTSFGLWPDPTRRDELTAYARINGDFFAQPVSLSMKNGSIREFLWSAERIAFQGKDCLINTQVDVTEERKNAAAYAEKVSLLALGAGIGKALTQAGLIDDALQNCAEHLVTHLGAAFARIWVLDDDANFLRLSASAGIYTHVDGRHSRLSLKNYPYKIGVIAREKRAIFTNAVSGDPHIQDQEWAAREGMKAFAGHPLVVDGTALGVIGIFFRHTITEATVAALSSVADEIALGVFRNRAETALRESEKKYRQIFDNASDAIFIAQNETIKFPNKAALAATGYSAEELEGCSLSELVYADDRDEVVTRHRMQMKGLPPQHLLNYRVIRKDGQVVWVESKAVNIQWEGAPASLNFLRDITSRIIMEERLERSQRLEAIGTLAGGIAHDFNNILSAIIGYTEIALLDAGDGAPLKKNLQKVLQAGERARHLVQQILAFSRQTDPEPKPVQIRLIVSEALKLLRATLPTTIAIHKDLSSQAAVMADPTQIHQVVMNLCTNAAQAMRDSGGTLLLTLKDVELSGEFISRYPGVREGRYLRFSVQDSGPGIPADIVNRVFDPFFTTKSPGEGTGLGLSVVHGIAEAHGGMVTVDSAPGKGATFHVYLPAIEAGAPEALETASILPTGTERVLFVDDEQLQIDLGRQILERLGYTVETFTDSREALRRFLETPAGFDAVITDMTMPHITGDLLAARLLAVRPDIPVIICTGYSDLLSEEAAAAMGIKAFIMKPVIMKDMAHLIRKILDSA
ncbi:MAG: PAS domain S-box protein [Pseudomonadota bacterium]